jgi:F-type H+-transporting ATPase subunit delta
VSSEQVLNIASETLNVSGLAGRYATAIFDLAQEAKKLDNVAKELTSLDAMLTESAELKSLTNSPIISAEVKSKAIAAIVAKAKYSDLVSNFVGVVANNSRLDQLSTIISEFLNILDHHNGVVNAHVMAASALTKAQVTSLKAKLKLVVGRDVNLETDVDESLLGGMVVRIGSNMIDSSLKTKLANLEESMKEVG